MLPKLQYFWLNLVTDVDVSDFSEFNGTAFSCRLYITLFWPINNLFLITWKRPTASTNPSIRILLNIFFVLNSKRDAYFLQLEVKT